MGRDYHLNLQFLDYMVYRGDDDGQSVAGTEEEEDQPSAKESPSSSCKDLAGPEVVQATKESAGGAGLKDGPAKRKATAPAVAPAASTATAPTPDAKGPTNPLAQELYKVIKKGIKPETSKDFRMLGQMCLYVAEQLEMDEAKRRRVS